MAGSSRKNVPQKATDQCHGTDGCAPMSPSSHAVAAGIGNTSTRLHKPMATSQAAYQNPGLPLRSIRSVVRSGGHGCVVVLKGVVRAPRAP